MVFYFEFFCGIDILVGMFKEFDCFVGEVGYGKEKMKVVCGDLFDLEGILVFEFVEFEYFNFDMVIMVFVLYYVEDVEIMLCRLVEWVCFGGIVFIVDFVGKERKDFLEGMGVVYGGFMED